MYRDDDEAARARADALQVDLDATRRELDAAKDELADAAATKRKLAEAEGKLAAAEGKLAGRVGLVSSGPPRASQTTGHTAASAAITAGVGLVILIAGLAYAVWRSDDDGGAEAAQADCTLETDPPGAEVIGRCQLAMPPQPQTPKLPHPPSELERRFGTTPLTMTAQKWLIESVICRGPIVARLPGYDEVVIDIPVGPGPRCTARTTTVKLTPAR